ncbi:putative oxidoreductase YrpG [Nymphon striatum]|nr:putative oxidoreductase YrpG [Nymphon striatum]
MSFGADTTEPYVQLGRSGLFVYRVGLGTMQFGWSVDEPGSFDVLDAYAEAGGNFIDTADCYTSWSARMGGPANAGGVSEEILGRWMAARGNRDDMVIATKVRAAMGEQFSEHRGTASQREGLSRRWITQACDDSLRRLGVDHIDLYQGTLHRPAGADRGNDVGIHRSGSRRKGSVSRLLQLQRVAFGRIVVGIRWARSGVLHFHPARIQPAGSVAVRSGDASCANVHALRHWHGPVQPVGWRPAHGQVPQGSAATRQCAGRRELTRSILGPQLGHHRNAGPSRRARGPHASFRSDRLASIQAMALAQLDEVSSFRRSRASLET